MGSFVINGLIALNGLVFRFERFTSLHLVRHVAIVVLGQQARAIALRSSLGKVRAAMATEHKKLIFKIS